MTQKKPFEHSKGFFYFESGFYNSTFFIPHIHPPEVGVLEGFIVGVPSTTSTDIVLSDQKYYSLERLDVFLLTLFEAIQCGR